MVAPSPAPRAQTTLAATTLYTRGWGGAVTADPASAASERARGRTMRIEIAGVIHAFDAALALIEDERQRALFTRLLAASRDSVERAIHEELRRIVAEVNEAAAGTVVLQLVYEPGGIELRVSRSSPDEPVDEALEFTFDAEDIDRLTLRLPAELKDIAATAAEQAGISLNTWLTRLVTREAVHRTRASRDETRGRRRGSGESLKGWFGG